MKGAGLKQSEQTKPDKRAIKMARTRRTIRIKNNKKNRNNSCRKELTFN